jgi:alpha-tubulin suppressor-like RCC1 family protein
MHISAGVDVSMAVSTHGEVYGWGNTNYGCIGVNNTKTNFVCQPHKVTIKNVDGEEIKAIDVEAGYLHSLIVGVDGSLHMCGNVEIDENDSNETKDDINQETPRSSRIMMEPGHIPDFNIWHRIAEPKEEQESTKWKKYGKYELKGRSAMMAEKEKWNI